MGQIFEIVSDPQARDRVENIGDNTIIVDRIWRPQTEFFFRLRYFFDPEYWMIPGVVYRGNVRGSGMFPRPKLSEAWWFREDRCSVPSGAIVEDSEHVVGVFVEPAKEEWELSSVSVRSGSILIRIPWMEAPLRYVGKGRMVRGVVKFFRKPHPYSRRIYVVSGNYRDLGYDRGYYMVLERAFRILGRDVEIDEYVLRKMVELKANYAIRVHYFRLGRISSFLQFVVPNAFLCGGSMSSAFTGKALEAALAIYRIGLITKNRHLVDLAKSVANFHCMGMRGCVLLTDYHPASGWWGYFFGRRRMANARMLGEATYYLLRLYEVSKRAGDKNDVWLLVPLTVGEFMIRNQYSDGAFPVWVGSDGRTIRHSGTNGSYIIWLLCELYRLTRCSRYLRAAKRAAEYHIRCFVEEDMYWGDTLDADTIDREGAHGILRALIMLYEVTKDARYLRAAQRAAYFVMSWMLMWDIPFDQSASSFSRGLKTYGLTIVSAENQHLDFYGMTMAVDLLKLARYTENPLWRKVAYAMISASMRLISGIDRRLRTSGMFLGYQPEQICHTEWAYSGILSTITHVVLRGLADVLRASRRKGLIANNVFWVTASTLNAALDIAEILGIRMDGLRVDMPNGATFRIFRLLRNTIALINVLA